MPLLEIEKLTSSHGLAIALLMLTVPTLVAVIVALFKKYERQNHKMVELLEARTEALERMLQVQEARHERR